MRKLLLLTALAALTACSSDDMAVPKTWSLLVEMDGQDFFVADQLTHRECMSMVYRVDKWTNGKAAYFCEENGK